MRFFMGKTFRVNGKGAGPGHDARTSDGLAGSCLHNLLIHFMAQKCKQQLVLEVLQSRNMNQLPICS